MRTERSDTTSTLSGFLLLPLLSEAICKTYKIIHNCCSSRNYAICFEHRIRRCLSIGLRSRLRHNFIGSSLNIARIILLAAGAVIYEF
jgi:hypothetical protein